MSLNIQVTRTQHPKEKPYPNHLGFGDFFTDHMFVMNYTEGQGWPVSYTHLDVYKRQNITKAFNKLMEGRTSFIIAHRLSTIRGADTILVMDKGAVVEQGSHGELMEKQGFYYRLYMSQFEQEEKVRVRELFCYRSTRDPPCQSECWRASSQNHRSARRTPPR